LSTRLGVLAGRGPLPGRIVEAARARGRDVFVVAFDGITEADGIADAPHAWVKLGAVGTTLQRMIEAGVGDVVLAGAVPRPSLRNLGLDARGFKMLAALGRGALGDDAVLGRIVAELETAGFRVVGVEDVLDDVLAPEGPLGARTPDSEDDEDIALGARVARGLGSFDIGQAVIVQGGRVLGVEAAEGTDALIRRCRDLRLPERGGVLVKVAKPCQDPRADLPAIGPATVELVADGGFAGIAVEAGRALVLERAKMRVAADARGIFVVGVRPEVA
jgi:hypothetical protein